MKTRKKEKIFPALLCMILVFGFSVRVTTAYMTDRTEPLNNLFTVGNIDIQLKEDHWDESEADALHPLQTVLKDPVVINNGSHPAYVFLEVTVPVRDIRVINEDGQKTDTAKYELFSFMPDLSKWSLIHTQEQADGKLYIYGYKEVLEPEHATVPLFQEVTSINYLEGDLDPTAVYRIDIQAKAIQSQIDAANMTLNQIYDLLGKELLSASA